MWPKRSVLRFEDFRGLLARVCAAIAGITSAIGPTAASGSLLRRGPDELVRTSGDYFAGTEPIRWSLRRW